MKVISILVIIKKKCKLLIHYKLAEESVFGTDVLMHENLKYDSELFKTCLMLDVISFMKYIRSSLLSPNRIPSS